MRDDNHLVRWIWINAFATVMLVVAFAVVAGLGWYSNHSRIDDIQRSRVESCKRTYLSFPLIFRKAFLPAGEKTWTNAQRLAYEKIKAAADESIRNCHRQTKP